MHKKIFKNCKKIHVKYGLPMHKKRENKLMELRRFDNKNPEVIINKIHYM